MVETFPTTPRAPTRVRIGAVLIGLAGVILATRVTITSSGWIGRTFPGFMLLDNRVVASVALAHWSGAATPGLFQSQVIAVDGAPVANTSEVYARVAARPLGSLLRYRLVKYGAASEVVLPSQRFAVRDWFLLFGPYLLNSIVYLTSGLVIWVLRPSAPLSRAFLAFGSAWALFFLTGMDVYGPATFFRLQYVGEPLAPATALQMVMLFPQPHRFARWRFLGYVPALAILVAFQWFLYQPSVFSTLLLLDMLYLGIVGLFLGWRLVLEYRRGQSQLARQRIRIVTLGTLFGFALPAAILVVSAFSAGGVAMNLGAFSPFLFALSLAYAIVKHDLFEIDAMVKRGAYYLLLTGTVGAAYIMAVVVFNLILQAGAVTDSPAFPVLFTLAVLVLFNPLRTRLQALVDRVFFRTRYESARVLAQVGGDLANALQRDQIGALVCDTVQGAIPNARTRLFAAEDDGRLRAVGEDDEVPTAVAREVATGRVVTAFDSSEVYRDPAVHEAVRAGLTALGAEIAVPLRHGTELTGVLTAGPKRSHLFYTAGDAEFLRALGHQAAIALANARSYEALVELNARLEERVRERTGQLEAANRELAEAYTELKAAEVQVVQSEKMASLGRLVAGVAHEINNPVSFIASNVAPLRRRLAQAARTSPADAQVLLREAQEIADIMARGAERTAAIVKDLRTFSRLGEASRKAVDLHEGLDVSLRLLESRWRDRITIHRDYGTVPAVEGDPGQLNQVFLNLLANACDAIPDRGNIWVATGVEGDSAWLTIRDDGTGMTPEVQARIFEPFYTTKDVGGGTGLGLAISHGVVTAHGGRIEVASMPGSGSTFRIVLPVAGAGVELGRAASS